MEVLRDSIVVMGNRTRLGNMVIKVIMELCRVRANTVVRKSRMEPRANTVVLNMASIRDSMKTKANMVDRTSLEVHNMAIRVNTDKVMVNKDTAMVVITVPHMVVTSMPICRVAMEDSMNSNLAA